MKNHKKNEKGDALQEGKMTKALAADNSTEAIARYIIGILFDVKDTVYEIHRMQDTLKWLLVSYHKYHDLLQDMESYRRAMQILSDGNDEKVACALKRAKMEIMEEWEKEKVR